MEAFHPACIVNVEVAHVQSHPTDLVAGHVAPALALVTNATACKRQGNIVVQGGIPVGPVRKEGAPGATAAARSSRPPTGKMSKVSGVKRKKVSYEETFGHSIRPARPCPDGAFLRHFFHHRRGVR
ncbi:hypothetical protein D1007_62205 [Hordeum vulgare]|nr:hypothetical protein D1007_62205 [Hordeum vulgare]